MDSRDSFLDGEFAGEISQWLLAKTHSCCSMDSLPEALRFTGRGGTHMSLNTHQHALRMRYVYICTLLYRPFLRLRIHH